MIRPNIFEYANRELSQDAVVCWLLACLRSTAPGYHEIGLNFIRFIFNDNDIQAKDVYLEPGSPHKQYSHMDVYAVIRVRNRLHPVIFENKTRTYLRERQFPSYCKKVAQWMAPENTYFANVSGSMDVFPEGWGDIVYVFFKSGYTFGWQKKDFEQQKEATCSELSKLNTGLSVKTIYLDDMVGFLERQNRDDLLDDYYKVLKKRNDRIMDALAHAMESAESCCAALDDSTGSNEAGCDILFENIFGSSCKFEHSHQQWATKNLFITKDQDGNETFYCYRFQWCSYKRSVWVPAFHLQQYRSEKSISASKKEALNRKIKEAHVVRGLCLRAVEAVNCEGVDFRLENIHDSDDGQTPAKPFDGQMLMKIFIVGDSGPQNVCRFLKAFSERLITAAKKKFGDSETIAVFPPFM